jgi:serine/threonine protein kinase
VAIGLAVALGRLHARGLIHKDIKPANILAHVGTGRVCRTLPGGAPGARRRVRWPPGPGAPSDQEPDGTARRSSMPCRTVSAPSCCVGSASVTYWSRGASPPHRPARTSRMQRGHAFSARP